MRRVVERALAIRFVDAVEEAIQPFQFAFSTRAGTNVLAMALRTAMHEDEDGGILSLDGVGAYDHIRQALMLG